MVGSHHKWNVPFKDSIIVMLATLFSHLSQLQLFVVQCLVKFFSYLATEHFVSQTRCWTKMLDSLAGDIQHPYITAVTSIPAPLD